MSLEQELEEFADLVMDVMSLYYRCRGFDANPTEVAQLDEALNKLMEEARRLGGLRAGCGIQHPIAEEPSEYRKRSYSA